MGLLDRNPRLGVKILLALARLVGMRLVEVSDELEACLAAFDSASRSVLRSCAAVCSSTAASPTVTNDPVKLAPTMSPVGP